MIKEVYNSSGTIANSSPPSASSSSSSVEERIRAALFSFDEQDGENSSESDLSTRNCEWLSSELAPSEELNSDTLSSSSASVPSFFPALKIEDPETASHSSKQKKRKEEIPEEVERLSQHDTNAPFPKKRKKKTAPPRTTTNIPEIRSLIEKASEPNVKVLPFLKQPENRKILKQYKVSIGTIQNIVSKMHPSTKKSLAYEKQPSEVKTLMNQLAQDGISARAYMKDPANIEKIEKMGLTPSRLIGLMNKNK